MTQDVSPEAREAAAAVGRDFATALVVFHDSVGRLLGLSSVEYKCVDLLRRLGAVPAGAIGEHTGLTTGAVTGLVDRLAKAGYVERVRDPDDRRRVVVRLVPNEQLDALMATAFGPYIDGLTKLADRYDEKELRAIGDWVQHVTDLLVSNTRRILAIKSTLAVHQPND